MDNRQDEGHRSATPPPQPINKQMAVKSAKPRRVSAPADKMPPSRRITRYINGTADAATSSKRPVTRSAAKSDTPNAQATKRPKRTPKDANKENSKVDTPTSNSARQSHCKQKTAQARALPKTAVDNYAPQKRKSSGTPAWNAKRARVDSEVYVVEEIIDRRLDAAREYEYYVKWKGYDHAQNTWEPRKHFTSEKLVEAFDRRMEEKEMQLQMGTIEAQEVDNILEELDLVTTRRNKQQMFDILTEDMKEASMDASQDEELEAQLVDLPAAEFDFSVRDYNTGNEDSIEASNSWH